MLSAEQNDSQSEEINVVDESQAENRPVFVQEAEMEKNFLVWPFCLLCVPAAQKIAQVWRVACKGGLCVNPSSRVAQLAGASSLHIIRPLASFRRSVIVGARTRKTASTSPIFFRSPFFALRPK